MSILLWICPLILDVGCLKLQNEPHLFHDLKKKFLCSFPSEQIAPFLSHYVSERLKDVEQEWYPPFSTDPFQT